MTNANPGQSGPGAGGLAAADGMEQPEAAPSCCGGPPKARADACCVRDEVAKAEGKPGCGCVPGPAPAVTATTCC